MGMDPSRFEHMALQISWTMHSQLGRGWVHDMIADFVRVSFCTSVDDAITMQSWNASNTRHAYTRFTERVDSYWENSMREESLVSKSKYDFL